MLGQSKPGKTSRNQNNIYLMFYGLSLSCPSCLLNEDSSALPWHKKQSCKRGWSDILELQCQQAKQTPSTPLKFTLFQGMRGWCLLRHKLLLMPWGFVHYKNRLLFCWCLIIRSPQKVRMSEVPQKHKVWQNFPGFEHVIMNLKLAWGH